MAKYHDHFVEICKSDEWNHLVFLRLIQSLKSENIIIVEKEKYKNNLKKIKFDLNKRSAFRTNQNNLITKAYYVIDKLFSSFAFKFNNIIFESFYFPKKEFLKICYNILVLN